MAVEKVKRTLKIIEEEAKAERLEIPLEDSIERIRGLFRLPKGVSEFDLNRAVVLGDQAEIDRLKALFTKCEAKRDRLIAELEAAADAEARDKIMCKVTLDPDAQY